VGVLLFNILSLAVGLSENTAKEMRQWHVVETKLYRCPCFLHCQAIFKSAKLRKVLNAIGCDLEVWVLDYKSRFY